jgi:hypothetical protein
MDAAGNIFNAQNSWKHFETVKDFTAVENNVSIVLRSKHVHMGQIMS